MSETTLRLKYNLSAKPVLADRDGEAKNNWVNGGTHIITASSTHVKAGTNSYKLAASGTGDFTTNYVSLASGNNATFVSGRSYVISLWVYAVSAQNFQIKTGGVTSVALTAAAGVWTHIYHTFVATSATTALQIILTPVIGTADMWFELDPIYESVDIPVLSIKGMLAGDWVQFYPEIINKKLDGSTSSQFKAFIRQIRVDCAPIDDRSAEELGILYWHLDNARLVDYGTETDVVWSPKDTGYELEWIDDFQKVKRWNEDFDESIARTSWPV
jgi:hypothetical protein